MIDFECSRRAKDGTPIVHDTDIHDFADVALIEQLVDIFGRSKTATRIQLQRYGLMMDETEYEMRLAQLPF